MSTTLPDSYEQFLTDTTALSQLRPNTLRAYRYELSAAALNKRFRVPLDDLTLAMLEQWISRKPASPSTIGRRAAALSRFFDWAIRHDLCERNPLVGRASVRSRRRLPRPVRNPDDLDAVETAIAGAPQPFRLIFTILRETGMRVSEVLDLRLGDVSLEASHEALRVREPKNGIERTVVLGPTATPKTLRGLRAYLKIFQGHGAHELLFRSNRGTRISYDAAHYQWARLCIKAGLIDEKGKPRYSIHQLRHTRGSELIAQGQRVEIVQRVLGHRDIRSTLGYAELNEAQVREALEQPGKR
ncbi:MAG TPA: tyrosine-type recombinase/integrase [Aggregatilineales bacterium]|nr:tyrosine-type recombinase/integrase [Aggregatilineales bacterium]